MWLFGTRNFHGIESNFSSIHHLSYKYKICGEQKSKILSNNHDNIQTTKISIFFSLLFFVSKFRNVRELWESHINSILKASISFWTVIYWIFQQWKRRHLFRIFWSKLPVTMCKCNGQAPTMSFFDWNNKPSILMWNVEHTI